jgi:CheY-specific phosphatase CheX
MEEKQMPQPIRLDDSLDRAMEQTFEGMAFTQIVRRAERSASEADRVESVWAQIEMIVPPMGELVLVVDARLGRRLEQVVTGAEGGDEADRIEVVGELVNALAGCWARILAPDAKDVRLGLPKLGRGDRGRDAIHQVAVYETDEQETVRILRIAPTA